MYFELNDEWNIKDSHQGLKVDANQILTRPQGIDSSWIIAVGTIVISKGEIKTWKIKMLNLKDICFGISDKNPDRDVRDVFLDNRPNSHGFALDNGRLYSSHQNNIFRTRYFMKDILNGSVVSMTLDMTGEKFGIVSYKVDDEDCGVAYNNIPIDKQYIMAVSLGYAEDEIQLLQ